LPPAAAPCRLLWGEREIGLREGENLVGRAAEATVRIDLGRISRLHARIVVSGGRAVLEDLGSTNGTFLCGERLRVPAELADGDEIGVGAIVLFRATGSDSTTETGTAR
jgi:pSer/pThr/pTyr-binding forkhead associated (FHA) protein